MASLAEHLTPNETIKPKFRDGQTRFSQREPALRRTPLRIHAFVECLTSTGLLRSPHKPSASSSLQQLLRRAADSRPVLHSSATGWRFGAAANFCNQQRHIRPLLDAGRHQHPLRRCYRVHVSDGSATFLPVTHESTLLLYHESDRALAVRIAPLQRRRLKVELLTYSVAMGSELPAPGTRPLHKRHVTAEVAGDQG